LARKDYSLIISLRGYVGYAKRFIAMVESKKDVEPSTKKALMEILQVMNKYSRRGLMIFVAAMLFMALLVAWFFILTITNTFGLQEVVAGKIVSGREISLVLGLVPVFSYFAGVFGALRLQKKSFEQAILNSLKNVNSEKFYSVL
jgi:hypothetical protein